MSPSVILQWAVANPTSAGLVGGLLLCIAFALGYTVGGAVEGPAPRRRKRR